MNADAQKLSLPYHSISDIVSKSVSSDPVRDTTLQQKSLHESSHSYYETVPFQVFVRASPILVSVYQTLDEIAPQTLRSYICFVNQLLVCLSCSRSACGGDAAYSTTTGCKKAHRLCISGTQSSTAAILGEKAVVNC